MKALDILECYSDEALDQVVADKVDEAANLRLPRSVVMQEVVSALNSLTYVARALAPTKPPTCAFLKLLLDAEDYRRQVAGFRDLVISTTEEFSRKAEYGNTLSADKDYALYQKVLKVAWESESKIDRSEALLLEALRNELGIWTSEHLLLEHHPDISQFWDEPGAYVSARSRLLLTGLVLTHKDHYVIAEEVATQIRRVWGIDLDTDDYLRLLNSLSNSQLYRAAAHLGLQVSGSKEEKIKRIVDALVPPSVLLEKFGIVELRDFCRKTGAQVSGSKAEVIANTIDFFDTDRDLIEDEDQTELVVPIEPETRILDNASLTRLLKRLTNDELYDMLYFSNLRTSGSKEEKVSRLVESPWSDEKLLSAIRGSDLSNLCRKIGINVSGAKSQLVQRLLEEAPTALDETTVKLMKEKDSETGLDPDEDSKDETEVELPVARTKTTPPSNIDEIISEFPELECDEQIVLALIKEARSLTEKEIERASRLHDLGWFLTRANMAELLAKLNNLGRNPIHVRSVQSTNIYEWLGIAAQDDAVVERQIARNIIDALRQGVVPENGLDRLAIGQIEARRHLSELLGEAKSRNSPFKFIRGPYGSGKTFLCSWLKERALENEFAVAMVNIGPDQPLSDLPVFYSGVINGLRTPEKRESSALVDILESWLLRLHNRTAQMEGIGSSRGETTEGLKRLVEGRVESELEHLADMAPGFSSALRAFYSARLDGNNVQAGTAVAWIRGSRSITSKAMREIGVRGYLEPSQVIPRVRALLHVIDGARYQGLVLIVDELELIRKFPHTRQREQALETLRLLIDESGKNGLPGCLLIFTGTDAFFDDDRAGLPSYHALAERVTVPSAPEGMVSVRQPILMLEGLDRVRLRAVVNKVKEMHGVAYAWDTSARLPDEFINQLVSRWTSFGEGYVARKPRPILKEFINILDLCEENPDVTPTEFLKGASYSNESDSQDSLSAIDF